MEEGFAFWFRFFNMGLASFVIVLCTIKLGWNHVDRARAFRIAGLAMLTVVVAWTAYDLRYEPFHPRIPLTTAGLILAGYGLMTLSTEPEGFRNRSK